MCIYRKILKFTAPEAAHVMDAISDEASLRIFRLIIVNAKDSESLKDELKMSYKIYYNRIRNLIETGLIKRKGRFYGITSFGQVVYEAYTKVSKAIENRSTLEIIDVVKGSEIPKDEFAKFANELIHDVELREIIVKQIATSS